MLHVHEAGRLGAATSAAAKSAASASEVASVALPPRTYKRNNI